MNEKNYFRNRIASEDNMKLFETTTHIEWDWRIETLAHIAVRLGMCFDIETDKLCNKYCKKTCSNREKCNINNKKQKEAFWSIKIKR